VAQFHTKGGRFTFTAQDHPNSWTRSTARDRANKIVILTTAGGEFIPGIDLGSFGNVADPGVWSQVHDEGVQIVENIANLRVAVIAAGEGRGHVHSEYALLASVIVASEGAPFQQIPHFAGGIVPGGGIFTTCSHRAGAGRAEAFLLIPQPITAATAYQWGVVANTKRQGAQPTGISPAIFEGVRNHTAEHSDSLHSATQGAYSAGSRLWAVTRRGIRGRPRETMKARG